MWSGPRNISTAMMRSWGNRADTFVCDEPFYAHYLKATGIDHPGRDEVIAHHETDWRKVVAWLTGPTPGGKAVFYQKHMSHHLLPNIERSWLDGLTHCFLIRDPREMLTSLLEHLPNPTLNDTGLPQQIELVHHVQWRSGRTPPIVDARDVLEAPRHMLELLCGEVGVAFDEAMLSWLPGRRATDGIWAKHWYEAVERSTGFQPYKPKQEPLPDEFTTLFEQCMECYSELHVRRLRA
ncbi:MAG: HAD family hydrolase [Planctomycetes bacterium]|nr:HAD family hydrolase [Planctomycetota bacterium]MBI3835733.1 HAD family hydrolase [Planctomycetota bacterium]